MNVVLHRANVFFSFVLGKYCGLHHDESVGPVCITVGSELAVMNDSADDVTVSWCLPEV
jgi:hypothetical protein